MNKVSVIIIFIGTYLLIFNGGLLDLFTVKQNVSRIKTELSELDKNIKEYKEKIKETKSKAFIERYARTKLGMVKKDEIIYEPK